MNLAKRTRAVESEMKMHLFVSCLVLISVVLHCGLAASASTVGLYAPDRYDGIPETCLLPMDFGYCRAKVKRYYFDMRRMKCAMFYFGGCAGNVNNFKSLEECNRVCLDGYGDYDSPNDVVATVNKASGRDYRGRGSVNSNSSNKNNNSGSGISSSSSSSSRGVSSNVGGIKNNTSATSYGGSVGALDASYKNSYSKYNSNTYSTNTNIGSNVNGNNSGISSSSGSGSAAGSAVNNNTKIIRNRSDDNLDEYDYEEN